MRPSAKPNFIDITHIDLNNPAEIDDIRKDIERSYQRVLPTLKYSPTTIKVQEVMMPCGVGARIGYVKNRPNYIEGEDSASYNLRYKGTDYVLVFRGRPYTDFHIILATETILQTEALQPDRLEVGLLMARILGGGSELFCNRVAPTSPNFHYQIIKSGHMTIWDADLSHWPAYAIEKQDQDPFRLAREISDKVQRFREEGAECDIFVKYDGTKYRSILIPRRVGDVYPSGQLGKKEDFGTIGSLEMAGYFVSCKNEESAALMMGNEGGALYEKALQELSYRPLSSPGRAVQLSEIVETSVNNERMKFIEDGNGLIASIAEKVTSEDAAGLGSLDKNTATAEIKQRVARAITAIESLDKKDITPEAKSAIEALKKNLNQFEADGAVGSLIVLARKAKRENQKLIIGLETDWIPGINEKGNLQRNAIAALMKEVDAIGEALKSMGLDNVEVIRGSGERLASALLNEADKTHTNLRNIVVMASTNTINSDNFATLKNADENNRPFLAGIDPTELIKSYEENGENSSKQLYIRLTGLLYMALELAAGKEPPQLPIIASYDKKMRIVIFLPKAEPLDYEVLKNTYAAEKTALAAA